MGLLADSSVLILYERRRQSPADLLRDAGESVATSAVCISELLVGLHRAMHDEQRARRQRFIDETTALLDVLPFDLMTATIHASITAELFRTGQPIGTADAMIAATALYHGYAVLTENVSEFQRVPGLEVRKPDW